MSGWATYSTGSGVTSPGSDPAQRHVVLDFRNGSGQQSGPMNIESARLITGVSWSIVLAAVIAAYAAGHWMGRRRHKSGGKSGPLDTVQGSLLALLGLLLAFSFSSAAGRFVDRQDLILQEANAIGTAYLRADLLATAPADELRAALKAYTAERVTYFNAGANRPAVLASIARSEQLHQRIWSAGVEGVKQTPTATVVVMQSLNEVIDLHASRVEALHRHLPGAVVVLLVMTAALAVGSVGFGTGVGGGGHLVGNLIFVVVTASVLALTLDLDYPRAGFVQIEQRPMLDLQRSLGE